MVKTIYRTNDGKEFDELSKAETYEAFKRGEGRLDQKLRELFNGKLGTEKTQHDLMRETIRAKAAELYRILVDVHSEFYESEEEVDDEDDLFVKRGRRR